MPDSQSQTTGHWAYTPMSETPGLSPRGQTIEAARVWLCWKCPDNTPEQIQSASVAIANIVLKLRVEAANGQ